VNALDTPLELANAFRMTETALAQMRTAATVPASPSRRLVPCSTAEQTS
jgi:hypothetical protein